MSIILMKSLFSILILFLSALGMFTMFEIFGRKEKRHEPERLRRFHKINGIIYLVLFSFVSYFCLRFIIVSGSELTPRGAFHAIFALTILVLLGLKVTFIHNYRHFYENAKTIGILIALITFGMVGTSGGYYLLASKFGTDKTFDTLMEYKLKRQSRISTDLETKKIVVRTEPENIEKGKKLYEQNCSFCHDPYSTNWGVGPGHKGILKNPLLPVSKRPATPENIAAQLRNPYRDMPSYSYLSEEEVLNLIAYLNTL